MAKDHFIQCRVSAETKAALEKVVAVATDKPDAVKRAGKLLTQIAAEQ